MGTGYTPIQLTQLRECCAINVMIPKYVPSEHFPTLWLSVRQGCTASVVSRPTTENKKNSWGLVWSMELASYTVQICTTLIFD